MNARGDRRDWYMIGGGRVKSPLYGIWGVDQQTIDGQLRSPLLNDHGRWRRVIFDVPNRVTFQRIDDSFARYAVTINVKDNTLVLTFPGQGYQIRYQMKETDAPWPEAFVEGIAADEAAACRLILIAMKRSGGWPEINRERPI